MLKAVTLAAHAKNIVAVAGRVIRKPGMRRTLLAVGIAVLVSMLVAPHKDPWHWGNDHFDWAYHSQTHYFPIFCYDHAYFSTVPNPVLWVQFFGQTAFAAVFAAVIVNVPWRRKKTTQRPL